MAREVPRLELPRSQNPLLPAESARLTSASRRARGRSGGPGGRVPFGRAGRALGVPPNSLRYASATGTVLLRWNGRASLSSGPCHRPAWTPRTHVSISRGGVSTSLVRPSPRRSPAGPESGVTRHSSGRSPARPSGDPSYLLWGTNREDLMPEARRRAAKGSRSTFGAACLRANGRLTRPRRCRCRRDLVSPVAVRWNRTPEDRQPAQTTVACTTGRGRKASRRRVARSSRSGCGAAPRVARRPGR